METYGGMYRNELLGLITDQGPADYTRSGSGKAKLITQGVPAADLKNPDPIKKKKALAMCRKEYLSCMVLWGSNNTKFYQLKIDPANSITMGQDQFPKTIVETQHLLNDYKMPSRQHHVKEPDSNGVAFLQNGGNPAPL